LWPDSQKGDDHIGSIVFISAPPVSFGLPRGRQPEGWALVTITPGGAVSADDQYLPAVPESAPKQP
jgi:hypothetical protein